MNTDQAETVLDGSESVQIARIDAGRLVSLSAGETIDGQAYSVSSLAPGYCMSRIPLLGAVLLLSGAGYCDLDDRLSGYVEVPFLEQHYTIAEVMNHEAGLTKPDLITWRMSGGRVPISRARPSPETPRGYSDALPGLALSALVESLAGCAAETFIRDELLRPSGARGLIEYETDGVAVNPAVWGLPDRYAPLLSERLSDQIGLVSPATGVFGSAEGFTRLLSWLFLEGPGAEGRRLKVMESGRDAHWDPVLQRVAKYSCGFMSDMSLLGLPAVSGESFGHTAAMSGWVAVVEPATGTASVGYSSGVLRSEGDGERVRRSLFLRCANADDTTARLESTSSAVSGCEDTPLSAGLIPATIQSSFFRRAESYIGVEALPTKCRFSVQVGLRDAETALLVFEGGALAGIFEASTVLLADVEIVSLSAELSTWIENSDDRLGPMLIRGTVAVTGKPWVLSSFEFWATKVQR